MSSNLDVCSCQYEGKLPLQLKQYHPALKLRLYKHIDADDFRLVEMRIQTERHIVGLSGLKIMSNDDDVDNRML